MNRKRRQPRRPAFARARTGQPWSERLRLPDEREYLLRPIQPEDAEALREGFRTLSPEDVRFRFLHPMRELSPEEARRLADIDRRRAFALVVAEPGEPGRVGGGAVARVAVDQDEAEFAVVVAPALRGHGLATYLLRKLIEWCRRKRLKAIYGNVLAENTAMLALAERLGFQVEPVPGEPGLRRIRLPLGRSSAA
jgi:RimJ/RimL family protein N-acetyltransferase